MRLFIFGFLVFCSCWAEAARITEVAVEPHSDGGFTDYESVTVKMLVEKDEPRVRVALRAFSLGAEDNAKLTAIHAEPFIAEHLVEFPAPKAGATPTELESPVAFVDQTFKVPIELLVLPDGIHRVGFVATVFSIADGSKLFEMASALQTISVDGVKKVVTQNVKQAEGEKTVVEARVVRADGTTESGGTVTVFPSKEKDGSVSLEEWERRVEERAKENPQALATPRRDVVQPMAKHEELVYFATSRKLLPIRGQQFKYKYLAEVRAKGIAGLTWGACALDLPTRDQEQSWWSSAKADVLKTYLYNEKKFLDELSNANSKDVMLFIHGYNNTFEDVVLQTGRMKRDLQFPGNVMAYSWPSAGDWKWYPADQAVADDEDNRAAFDYVLEQVVMRAKSQGGKVYLLGHSMGNRFLIHALRKLYLKRGEELAAVKKADRTLSVVVFAAPDVDYNTFSSSLPSVVSISNMVSFYYSTKDRALLSSEAIHDLDRAGLHPLFHDEVTTVNLDRLNGWFSLGHGTYSSSDRAIFDLYLQFRYHRLPANRIPPLEEDIEGEKKLLFKHWYLNP